MSEYLEKADYAANIRTNRLDMIIEDDPVLLDVVESSAIALVRDALHSRFDVDDIFGRRGADRHAQVLRWVKTLVVYFIYERIPDRQMPERVETDYRQTLDWLGEIEDGKKSVDLPRRSEGDQPAAKFRWGSLPRRTY